MTRLLKHVGKWRRPLVRLEQYRLAPRAPGVYHIGFHRPGQPYPRCVEIGYPADFWPMYIGRTGGSIRTRLSAHCRKRGNKGVAAYQRGLARLRREGLSISGSELIAALTDGLYFTCREIHVEGDADFGRATQYWEARNMARYQPAWNRRSEWRWFDEPEAYDYELF